MLALSDLTSARASSELKGSHDARQPIDLLCRGHQAERLARNQTMGLPHLFSGHADVGQAAKL